MWQTARQFGAYNGLVYSNMRVSVSKKQLGGLLDDLLPSLKDNGGHRSPPGPPMLPNEYSESLPWFRFGAVRFGIVSGFSEKAHAFVVVDRFNDIPPPTFSVRPSTSQKHKPATHILILPPRAIDLMKTFETGDMAYVVSYILCHVEFKIPFAKIARWRYLNRLAPEHIAQLEQCLEAARKRRHG